MSKDNEHINGNVLVESSRTGENLKKREHYLLCRSDFTVIRKCYLRTNEIQAIRSELTEEWIVYWNINGLACRMTYVFGQSSCVILRTTLNSWTRCV